MCNNIDYFDTRVSTSKKLVLFKKISNNLLFHIVQYGIKLITKINHCIAPNNYLIILYFNLYSKNL